MSYPSLDRDDGGRSVKQYCRGGAAHRTRGVSYRFPPAPPPIHTTFPFFFLPLPRSCLPAAKTAQRQRDGAGSGGMAAARGTRARRRRTHAAARLCTRPHLPLLSPARARALHHAASGVNTTTDGQPSTLPHYSCRAAAGR